MNSCTIIGNVTRDPEVRTTQQGITVCSFSVAVNNRQGQDAQFFNVSAWRTLGENCGKYLAKGRKVCVVGPVSVRTYEAKDGTTRANLEINANQVEFLSASSESNKSEQSAGNRFEPVDDEPLPF